MSKSKLTIFVEGRVDNVVVRNILYAARINGDVEICVCDGKRNIARVIHGLRNTDDKKFIALIDADEISIQDSRELAHKQLGSPSIQVFCAVPTIEAWLFADELSAQRVARESARASGTLSRLPLPETIPYPKILANNVFGKNEPERKFEFLRHIDIDRAAARSPSLRTFLGGVAEAMGEVKDFTLEPLRRSVGRDAFSTLLRELPRETIVWKTLDGTRINAATLAQDISEGADIGKQYVTEVLRVARDLIARTSSK